MSAAQRERCEVCFRMLPGAALRVVVVDVADAETSAALTVAIEAFRVAAGWARYCADEGTSIQLEKAETDEAEALADLHKAIAAHPARHPETRYVRVCKSMRACRRAIDAWHRKHALVRAQVGA